jgi:hypothetical protein
MANLIINLTVKDIQTSKLGENYMITCENNLNITLTPEAMEELFKDYKYIKSLETEQFGLNTHPKELGQHSSDKNISK